MLARLGEVLYWSSCVLAVLIALLGGFAAWGQSDAFGAGITIVLAVIIAGLAWAAGRGAVYVLAGR